METSILLTRHRHFALHLRGARYRVPECSPPDPDTLMLESSADFWSRALYRKSAFPNRARELCDPRVTCCNARDLKSCQVGWLSIDLVECSRVGLAWGVIDPRVT